MRSTISAIVIAACLFTIVAPARASGHGPVFGAATPTLGRGGWSVDNAYTFRAGDDADSQQMFKTMVSFGITETVQVSGSFPVVMSDGLTAARMMSAMSSDREVEGLLAYRFQRRTVGIGGRQESTLYLGGTVPTETERGVLRASSSVEVQLSTGYASRAHYAWIGGGVQHYLNDSGDQPGQSRLLTAVYGYRPPALRTEAGKPDLRFFVEATAEDRGANQIGGVDARDGGRTLFVGPTSLLLYKAVAVEGGILFPLYQHYDVARAAESMRVAVNVAYFFWLD
jgi:hypothetical protein